MAGLETEMVVDVVAKDEGSGNAPVKCCAELIEVCLSEVARKVHEAGLIGTSPPLLRMN